MFKYVTVLRKNNQNMDSALLFNNLFIKLQSKVSNIYIYC